MGQFGNYKGSEEWLEKLSKQQEKEFLEVINLKVENELLFQFIKDNPLPFCVKVVCNNPFDIRNRSTSMLVNLITMINNGELILKDAKV